MKRLSFCFVLLLATFALAQQEGQPPTGTSPQYPTTPTFPETRQTPKTQMPPDTQAPAPEALSSKQVEQQITARLSAEPALANANLNAKADDNSVVLTGTVGSEQQHDLALRIAQSYAGERR